MAETSGRAWLRVCRGHGVQNISASANRTFVLYAQTDRSVFVTRDGGMSWRAAADVEPVKFQTRDFKQWQQVTAKLACRISEDSKLMVSRDGGQTGLPSMK